MNFIDMPWYDVALFWIMLVIGIAVVGFITYVLSKKAGLAAAHKEWEVEKQLYNASSQTLQQEWSNFKMQQAQFKDTQIKALEELSQKKTKVLEHYNQACKVAEEARDLREKCYQEKQELQTKISQLQNDLHHARQRSKRIAAKQPQVLS